MYGKPPSYPWRFCFTKVWSLLINSGVSCRAFAYMIGCLVRKTIDYKTVLWVPCGERERNSPSEPLRYPACKGSSILPLKTREIRGKKPPSAGVQHL